MSALAPGLYDVGMLLNLLLGSVVDPSRPDLAAAVSQRLEDVSEREWAECLRCLRNHRIEAPVWSSLLALGLQEAVPRSVARTLHRAHVTSVIRSTAQMRRLSRILTALGQHGIEPVLLKGVALLNSLYPNIGARPCGDIDFLVESEAMPTVDKVIVELGYRHQSETTDAKMYVDRQGVTLDVHHRFKLFEDIEGFDLISEVTPQFASVPTISVFEPNALLVHLVFHLRGHRRDMGYFLAWILDIGLLLNQCRSQLEVERIWALMPNRETAALLSRIIGFFARETGTELIEEMPWERNGHPPLTGREILRIHRRAIWKLERPIAALKLLVRGLNPASAQPLPELRFSDLLQWPGDVVRERRSVSNTLPLPARRT